MKNRKNEFSLQGVSSGRYLIVGMPPGAPPTAPPRHGGKDYLIAEEPWLPGEETADVPGGMADGRSQMAEDLAELQFGELCRVGILLVVLVIAAVAVGLAGCL